MKTVTRGPFRIALERPTDGRNVYYGVDYFRRGEVAQEIVYVGGSRIAFNNAVRKHGNNLLNITNLETGTLVVGAK